MKNILVLNFYYFTNPFIDFSSKIKCPFQNMLILISIDGLDLILYLEKNGLPAKLENSWHKKGAWWL